jgi:hypothetical protein
MDDHDSEYDPRDERAAAAERQQGGLPKGESATSPRPTDGVPPVARSSSVQPTRRAALSTRWLDEEVDE